MLLQDCCCVQCSISSPFKDKSYLESFLNVYFYPLWIQMKQNELPSLLFMWHNVVDRPLQLALLPEELHSSHRGGGRAWNTQLQMEGGKHSISLLLEHIGHVTVFTLFSVEKRLLKLMATLWMNHSWFIRITNTRYTVHNGSCLCGCSIRVSLLVIDL